MEEQIIKTEGVSEGNYLDSDKYDIKGCRTELSEPSRFQGWERKLLDLTLRNSMLNLKPGKTIAPLWETDVASIVRSLKEGTLDKLVGVKDKDNHNKLKELYRAARNSLEENGANSLFLSLGTLRWFDVDDPREHIAPLIFVPINITRKKAMTYNISLRENEAMVNVTLLEMLRRMFGITLSELMPIPEDDEGFPDWRKIFDVFQENVVEINKRQSGDRQWELPMRSFVGIFSFTKFLLWNDIHDHANLVGKHHIIRGLLDNHYQPIQDRDNSCARDIERESPEDLMLPVDYDSSQLEAVAESHAGNSFVLHGPPGTGKSQTITNMIADALYNGKKVLFVAEKKAALDVVMSRLRKIGLGSYCLELHSNKTDKKSFFAQLNESKIQLIGNGGGKHSLQEYREAADVLNRSRNTLIEITESLHHRNEELNEPSLYEYIGNYLKSGYECLSLKYEDISNISPQVLKELCDELKALDLVVKILGYHPSQSSLIGLYPKENTIENQKQLSETMVKLQRSIDKARKRAVSLINRWFLKKTPRDYFDRDELWIRVRELARIDAGSDPDLVDVEANIQRWCAALDKLRLWYHFSDRANAIIDFSASFALDYFLDGHSGKETAQRVESSYHKVNACRIIDYDGYLRGFNGEMHELMLERYRKSVADFQEVRQKMLVERMTSLVGEACLTTEENKRLGQLSKRMLSNGRGVPLRKIISDAGNVMHKLFPCMLMSPLSVAQYLEMQPDIFDLIIFDEASQMETPDAIGVIARGKALVVVGDPKQLPPTRFFTTLTTTGEEIEESEDADSILEDCIAMGMPSRYLSRHYRSRHESLIAFSNQHFYEGKLMTFPSHNDREKKISVFDPQGEYDYGKTRTNRIEAECVVDKIIELFEHEGDSPSVGVVAFSKAQSSLIEDLLNAKLQRHKIARQNIDCATEPLFIKNLENVQGDERDIIIFSIGYGPDKKGKVSLNFGPINRKGGERRLNVAVSRARDEMIVFSSLKPYHITDDGLNSLGVKALRDFLSYASANSEGEFVPNKTFGDYIINDIANSLKEKGVIVDTEIGRSSFKIDLAVKLSEDSEDYIMGILIDGMCYNSLPTVRDREVTIPTVLKMLGWKIKRVWVIDWFENRERVIESILEALKGGESSEL